MLKVQGYTLCRKWESAGISSIWWCGIQKKPRTFLLGIEFDRKTIIQNGQSGTRTGCVR